MIKSKRILSILLICIIFTITIGTLSSCSLVPQTMTGEIVLCFLGFDNKLCLYIKPSIERENDDLVLFQITDDTEIDPSIQDKVRKSITTDEEILNLSGLKVEIKYRRNDKLSVYIDKYSSKSESDKSNALLTYGSILSIKPADETSPVGNDKFYHELSDNQSEYELLEQAGGDGFEVLYVAKINTPIKGYILYVGHIENPIPCVITDETQLSDEVRSLIESQETGYDVTIHYFNKFIFKDTTCGWLKSVELDEN